MSDKKRVGVDPLKVRKDTKIKKEKRKVSKSVSKHTDIQTSKDTNKHVSKQGQRATFYIKKNLLRELKILAVDIPDKNLSELVNEAIEDLIKKYGW